MKALYLISLFALSSVAFAQASPSISYATYLGGTFYRCTDVQPGGCSGQNTGPAGTFPVDVTVDSAGNMYVAGHTDAVDFPITQGAHQTKIGEQCSPSQCHSNSSFVSKFNPQGQLIWSTFATQGVSAIRVDANQNVYVGGIFVDLATGLSHIFVEKLNPTGSKLLYRQALEAKTCSNFQQGLLTLAAGKNGIVYASGYNETQCVYITPDALFKAGGSWIAELDTTKTGAASVLHSTYWPVGPGGITQIALGPQGNLYLAGAATPGFPTTKGAFQTIYGGGSEDAFVSKLAGDLSTVVYSTYLGGTGGDRAWTIQVNDSDNAFVAGSTTSANFPATSSFGTDTSNLAFMARLNPTGHVLRYSAIVHGAQFFGEGQHPQGAVDNSGNFYLTCTTSVPAGPYPVVNAFQPNLTSSFEACVLGLNSSGNNLLFSSYLGGSTFGWGVATAFDSAGNMYTTGATFDTDYPVTSNAFQSTLQGGASAALTRISTGRPSTWVNLRVGNRR